MSDLKKCSSQAWLLTGAPSEVAVSVCVLAELCFRKLTHAGGRKVGTRVLGLTYLEAIECGLAKINLRGSSWGKLDLKPGSRYSSWPISN